MHVNILDLMLPSLFVPLRQNSAARAIRIPFARAICLLLHTEKVILAR
jgi:hypothetical protein